MSIPFDALHIITYMTIIVDMLYLVKYLYYQSVFFNWSKEREDTCPSFGKACSNCKSLGAVAGFRKTQGIISLKTRFQFAVCRLPFSPPTSAYHQRRKNFHGEIAPARLPGVAMAGTEAHQDRFFSEYLGLIR
jgi:hypothetical protein